MGEHGCWPGHHSYKKTGNAIHHLVEYTADKEEKVTKHQHCSHQDQRHSESECYPIVTQKYKLYQY